MAWNKLVTRVTVFHPGFFHPASTVPGFWALLASLSFVSFGGPFDDLFFQDGCNPHIQLGTEGNGEPSCGKVDKKNEFQKKQHFAAILGFWF